MESIKRILSCLLVIVAISCSASNLFESANKKYSEEKYSDAIELYKKAIESEGYSSDLLYNLANAYYRSGDDGNAILFYERALRLDPANTDARHNLNYVNSRIVDKKGEVGSFLYNSFRRVVDTCSSNTWAWYGMLSVVLLAFCFSSYYFSDKIIIKKFGFFGALFFGFISIIIIIFAFKARQYATDPSEAIIMSETAELSTVPRAPSNRNEEAMLLHEGTKVRILRSISLKSDSIANTWHEVEIDNNHRAWINNDDIKIIYPFNDDVK